MPITITPVTLADLTTAAPSGTGVFDTLMRANRAHLELEFKENRIKGSEYATVYLGGLESVLAASVAFLLQKDKNALEAQLLEQQVILAQVEVIKANAQILQVQAQTAMMVQQQANLLAELAIIQANVLKVPAEIAVLEAQATQIGQQTENLVSQKAQIEQQTLLVTQQTANAVIEGLVLDATECKLRAEYEVLLLTKDKVIQETGLLLQKKVTEVAQVTALGVDADSVVGRQKGLYVAQTLGFTRDAEQKAAKALIDTWSVRRSTDEGTIAGQALSEAGAPIGVDNGLGDANIARAVAKLLAGIGA